MNLKDIRIELGLATLSACLFVLNSDQGRHLKSEKESTENFVERSMGESVRPAIIEERNEDKQWQQGPLSALEELLEAGDKFAAAGLLREWAIEDPDSAQQWFDEEKRNGQLTSDGLREDWSKHPLLGGLISGIAYHDQEKAWNLFVETKGPGRTFAQEKLTETLVDEGVSAAEIITRFQVRSLTKSRQRKLVRDLAVGLVRDGRRSEIPAFFEANKMTPQSRREIFVAAMTGSSTLEDWRNRLSLLQEDLPEDEQRIAFRELRRRLDHQDDGDAQKQWIAELPDHFQQ